MISTYIDRFLQSLTLNDSIEINRLDRISVIETQIHYLYKKLYTELKSNQGFKFNFSGV